MVAMFVDKVLSACCGDSDLMNKLAGKKNHDNEEDEDIADEGATTNNKPDPNKVTLMKKKKGKFTDKESKHELLKWKDLPLKARRAAEDLGFDDTKWDAGADLAVEHKHWEDLTEKELKAVEFLGWDKDAWEHKYEESDWADLPELQKKAATAAGFDQEKWDDDDWPTNLDRNWDDLSDEDREAMAVLGWTQPKWDE